MARPKAGHELELKFMYFRVYRTPTGTVGVTLPPFPKEQGVWGPGTLGSYGPGYTINNDQVTRAPRAVSTESP